MEQGFIDILQKLIEEQGKEALLNASKCKAFLADYTRNEYKKESRFLLQAINAGVQRAIDSSQELPICKKQQVRLLHEDYGLVEKIAADVVDTLSFVLRGDTARTETQGTDNMPDNKTIQDQAAEEERLKSAEKKRQAAAKAEQAEREAEERKRSAKERTSRLAREIKEKAERAKREAEEKERSAKEKAEREAKAKQAERERSTKEKAEQEAKSAEAAKQLIKTRERIAKYQACISAVGSNTVGLKADGTVVAARDRGNVSGWRGIIAVAVGLNHIVGLKADGTVVAGGSDDKGQCNVSGWRDIAAVAAYGGNSAYTIGLKADGTVVAVGSNTKGQCNVSDWRDIAAVAVGGGNYGYTVGLKTDGTVVAVGDNDKGQCNVSGWRDIAAVVAGDYHTVGLKKDGTVVAAGNNDKGQCDVSGWRDIVAVAAKSAYTVGLKADGTVVAAGNNDKGQCDVSGWRNIVAIAVSWHTVGLKADGTVVAVGNNKTSEFVLPKLQVGSSNNISYSASSLHEIHGGQCEVSGWRDIVAVAVGDNHTVGLKADGTVVAVGNNKFDQCNVSNFRGIGPFSKEQAKARAEQEAAQLARWKAKGRCAYCGGRLALFTKKCKDCNKEKNY